MIQTALRPFAVLTGATVLIGLACNAITGTVSTPQVQPTRTPEPSLAAEPTATPPEPTSSPRPPRPTASPTEPEQQVDEDVPFELSDTAYLHPQGLFEMFPPDGWEVLEDDGSVLFEATDYSGAINVQVTNTSYALDGGSFERLIDAREANLFSSYDGYSVIGRSVNKEDGTATVTKSLIFDGVPQIVSTSYDQHGPAVYALDFWADEAAYDGYAAQYDRFFDNVVVNSDAALEQEPYLWVYTFYGPEAKFSIEVPMAWSYEVSEGEFAIVDTFYAPDEHAVIQNITYDDGQEISRSVAGAFALELLREFYASDIRITDDQVQPDGSERLIWHSPGGDYSGVSFFESRGTTFLLFTVMYDNPYETDYLNVLDYTISTYEVP